MRINLLLGYFLLLLQVPVIAQVAVVNNIGELTATTASSEMLLVKDAATGGMFVHSDSAVKADGGTSFVRKAGGYWLRQFDRSQGVNPCWWGAVGDAVHDDLPALNAATAYCIAHETVLQFPSGIFRITAPWIIGGKTISEQQLFSNKPGLTASFDMKQHNIARTSSPVIVRGSVKTCIYGDFTADTLTAIVYYNIKSMGSPSQASAHLYTHEFSNIGIYGKGYFKGTKAAPDTVDPNNRQIGLVMLFSTNNKIDGCGFFGLQYGLVCRMVYFASISNCNFELCRTGISTRDFNSNLLQNITGGHCKLLLELTGSQLVVNNLNAEFCETALLFTGANTVFNGIYCENYLAKPNAKAQLIFGKQRSDTGYNKNFFTSGVVINALTISSGAANAIQLEDDCRQVNINGGSIFGNILSKNSGNVIFLSNIAGPVKMIGEGRLVKQ